VTEDREDGAWRNNYFNYFTEVEEQFQKARGTGLFLLSPLDWALIEAWKNSGIPLEAVLRGIDAAFEKWRARKNKSQMVNSLTYCAQAVMKEAESMANNVPSGAALENADSAPFPEDTVRAHLQKAVDALDKTSGYEDITTALREMQATLDQHFQDLEQFDQRLSDETLFQMRRELDLQLKPYRGKMTADQLARLEKSFLDRKVYDHFSLPRLSLFYMT